MLVWGCVGLYESAITQRTLTPASLQLLCATFFFVQFAVSYTQQLHESTISGDTINVTMEARLVR